MGCDVGEAMEKLENELCSLTDMGGSPGDISEEPLMQEKQKKG